MENNGFKIPISIEQKEIGKNLAQQIAELEEQKKKLKLNKLEKWQEMKKDKQILSEVFQEFGIDKFNDRSKEFVVKTVPEKWYKKKGMKLIYQAVENVLGQDAPKKLKEEISKKKKALSETYTYETTVAFREKDLTKKKNNEINRNDSNNQKESNKKKNNDRNSTKRKETRKRKIFEQLETLNNTDNTK